MTQPPKDLTDNQLLRYSRHILLPQVDIVGQQRITNSRVLVLGAGGLGSPILLYLAAAGVGELLIADGDRVDETNLQRQIVHRTESVGAKKTSSARATLAELNPDVHVTEIDNDLDEASILAWARGCDAVVIGTDNFSSRYAANRACMALGIPLISGAAIGLSGQLSVFDFRRDDSPCYSCLFPDGQDDDVTCATAGVLGPVVGIVGSVQAVETLKILAGFGEPLVGTLLMLDATDLSWQRFQFNRQPDCPVCQQR
ncbi:ThiF family adenylyltransferase [Saccharospirillum sp.]|uniref:ThiF family adenylyltransferase n=1 Tax=Saccharospirillum sp. TaxID=2033801 RepID=UPI0034A05CC5